MWRSFAFSSLFSRGTPHHAKQDWWTTVEKREKPKENTFAGLRKVLEKWSKKNEGKKITYSHQFLNRYSLISFAFFFLQPKWWLLFFCTDSLAGCHLNGVFISKPLFCTQFPRKLPARSSDSFMSRHGWQAQSEYNVFILVFFSSLRFCLFLFQVKSAAFFALNDRSGCDGRFLELFYASSRKWKLWWCWPGPGPIKWPPVRQRKRS